MGKGAINTRISVVGMGLVGLVTATVLASKGHQVSGIDIDKTRIMELNKGKIPMREPYLDTLLQRVRGNLSFSRNYDLVASSEAVFVCVDTPNKNGRIDLTSIFSAMESITKQTTAIPVAVKSTVVPGTAMKIFEMTGIRVVSNPEFLSEGNAILDTTHPDRIIIGGVERQKMKVFRDLWSFTKAPVIETSNENSELIKFASNAFLATKVSFVNEIANLCEKIPGTDSRIVAHGLGLDKRISPFFLNPGLGYGGPCLPKDVKSLLGFANETGERLRVLEAVDSVNDERVRRAVTRIEEKYGDIRGKKICVLGIAFKDKTDDIRSSKSIELINELVFKGGIVTAYDPVVKGLRHVKITESKEVCIQNCDLAIVATESSSFKNLKHQPPITIDLRGIVKNGQPDMTVGVHV